jgi:outer membrane protein
MLRIKIVIYSLFIISSTLASENVLDKYIKIGLESNLALKQQKYSFDQSMKALKEARGMFFPSITFLSRYTRAGGGRTIEFPVGDLVNPIYQTLNEILQAVGQDPKPFPVVPNETIPFLRPEEQETKLRLIQPLFQPAIYYNHALKSNLVDIEALETTIYKRELIKEIKISYFNYLRAYYVIDLFNETELLLKENLRVSEKLFSVQKVTRDAIYRSDAELSRIEQRLLEAKNNLDLSRSYLNFLLNRPLTEDIEIDETLLNIENYNFPFDTAYTYALNNREEIVQLETGLKAADNSRKIKKSNYFPGVSIVADYGFQGPKYQFYEDDAYWMASMVFEWNLFRGLQDQAKIEQAALEMRKMQVKLQELKLQLELQVRDAYNRFMLSQKKIEVANKLALSSEKSYEIVNKKYNEGMAALVEFLDARNNMTNSQINRILANYDYYTSFAELERVTSFYKLNDMEENHED